MGDITDSSQVTAAAVKTKEEPPAAKSVGLGSSAKRRGRVHKATSDTVAQRGRTRQACAPTEAFVAAAAATPQRTGYGGCVKAETAEEGRWRPSPRSPEVLQDVPVGRVHKATSDTVAQRGRTRQACAPTEAFVAAAAATPQRTGYGGCVKAETAEEGRWRPSPRSWLWVPPWFCASPDDLQNAYCLGMGATLNVDLISSAQLTLLVFLLFFSFPWFGFLSSFCWHLVVDVNRDLDLDRLRLAEVFPSELNHRLMSPQSLSTLRQRR
ncbi:hypothetical protein HPB49_003520 [Dermacentor silvarum]|uniref:Uncharacterized protein n=1 Tax=Dermacentor silvarum TaxID=543639 RepID=A0ACB8DTP1_DERSI|nr:hypothetical protein HPB49_003520 [Dermacentor silvarum]